MKTDLSFSANYGLGFTACGAGAIIGSFRRTVASPLGSCVAVFVRDGPSSRELTPMDAVDYIKDYFKEIEGSSSK